MCKCERRPKKGMKEMHRAYTWNTDTHTLHCSRHKILFSFPFFPFFWEIEFYRFNCICSFYIGFEVKKFVKFAMNMKETTKEEKMNKIYFGNNFFSIMKFNFFPRIILKNSFVFTLNFVACQWARSSHFNRIDWRFFVIVQSL